MSGVINDPEALAHFRLELEATVDSLQKQMSKTINVVELVGKVWKDIQFQKFQQKFEEDAIHEMTPLCNDIEEFNHEILLPLEEILKRYLEL